MARSVKLSDGTHAKATLAAEHRGITLNAWMEEAALAQLERDREAIREQQYQNHVRQAHATGGIALHRHEFFDTRKKPPP